MELSEIIKQAESAEELMASISAAELKLKEDKAALRKILEEDMPNMFVEVGITSVDLASGINVGLKQIFAVNMPAAGAITKAKPEQKKKLIKRLNGCVAWLRKHKGADIIKTSVVVDFNAEDNKIAKELFTELNKRKLHPVRAQVVHPGKLKAFLREKWDNDVEIPVELFETYTGQTAEFTLPKPSKKGGK